MSGVPHEDDIDSTIKLNDSGIHAGSHVAEDSPSSDTTRESSTSPNSNDSCQTSSQTSTSSSTYGHAKVQPSQTSLWVKGHLVDLKIRVSSFCDWSKSPLDIVNMLEIGQQSINAQLTLAESRAKMIAKRIQKMTLFLYILDKVLDDMSLKDALHLSTQTDIWKIHGMESKDEEGFNNRFQASGQIFAMWLRHCIYLRDVTKDTISEFMYQHLFVLFLQLFGVKCLFSPAIPKRTMRIRNHKVSGMPDIMASWYCHQNSSFECKTLFVCEVKKSYERGDEPQPKALRFSSPTARSDPPMPDTLLGQHGAELLMYYPTSLAENVVIGMIVEKTHVSFTALSSTRSQYIDLLNGSLKSDRENGPKLIYTRPYNYLLKEDRDHLIEAFLKLGFIQEIGENYLSENFNP